MCHRGLRRKGVGAILKPPLEPSLCILLYKVQKIVCMQFLAFSRCRSTGRQIRDDRSQNGTILVNDFAFVSVFAVVIVVAAKYKSTNIRGSEIERVSQFPNLKLIFDSA